MENHNLLPKSTEKLSSDNTIDQTINPVNKNKKEQFNYLPLLSIIILTMVLAIGIFYLSDTQKKEILTKNNSTAQIMQNTNPITSHQFKNNLTSATIAPTIEPTTTITDNSSAGSVAKKILEYISLKNWTGVYELLASDIKKTTSKEQFIQTMSTTSDKTIVNGILNGDGTK